MRIEKQIGSCPKKLRRNVKAAKMTWMSSSRSIPLFSFLRTVSIIRIVLELPKFSVVAVFLLTCKCTWPTYSSYARPRERLLQLLKAAKAAAYCKRLSIILFPPCFHVTNKKFSAKTLTSLFSLVNCKQEEKNLQGKESWNLWRIFMNSIDTMDLS